MNTQEMFEELGYSYDFECDELIQCEKYFPQAKVTMIIKFDIEDKEYSVFIIGKSTNMNISIDKNEHKAIHQQVKELGWLDDWKSWS